MSKKIFLILMVMILCTTVVYAVSIDPNVRYGDVNDDGIIDTRDMLMIARFVNGFDEEINEKAADMALDGKIDYCDAYVIPLFLSGYDITLPHKDTFSLKITNKDDKMHNISVSCRCGVMNINDDLNHVFVNGKCICGAKEVIYGDANDDGVVDLFDYTIISLYLIGRNVDINKDAADVALDGKIDVCDEEILGKYFADYDVELPHVDKFTVTDTEIFCECGLLDIKLEQGVEKNYSKYPFTKDRAKNVIKKGSYSSEDWKLMEQELEAVIENAGKGTRAALVESAMYLLELEYLVPYQGYGGYGFATYGEGLNNSWGTSAKDKSGAIRRKGLDCTGYVNWIFANAGVKKPSFNWHGDGKLKDYANKLDEIELGDIIQWRGPRGNVKDTQTHIAIIVGIDEENIYYAESVSPGLRLAKLPIAKMKNLNTRTKEPIMYLHKIENRLGKEVKDGNFQNHTWSPDDYVERTR